MPVAAIGPDDPGGVLLARVRSANAAPGRRGLDACQWAVERLLRAADAAGLRLAVRVGVTPGSRSARARLTSCGRSSAGRWASPGTGRLSVLATLELPVADERLKSLAAGGRPWSIENDAVGVEAGYLPGLGERDRAARRLRPAGLVSPAS